MRLAFGGMYQVRLARDCLKGQMGVVFRVVRLFVGRWIRKLVPCLAQNSDLRMLLHRESVRRINGC